MVYSPVLHATGPGSVKAQGASVASCVLKRKSPRHSLLPPGWRGSLGIVGPWVCCLREQCWAPSGAFQGLLSHFPSDSSLGAPSLVRAAVLSFTTALPPASVTPSLTPTVTILSAASTSPRTQLPPDSSQSRGGAGGPGRGGEAVWLGAGCRHAVDKRDEPRSIPCSGAGEAASPVSAKLSSLAKGTS